MNANAATVVDHCAPASVNNVVILPGWSLPASVYGSFAAALPAQFRATVVPLPPAETLRAMAEKALALAPARAIWCGHSLGGMVALQAVLLAPERCSALLLLACTPSFVARDGWPFAMPAETLAAFADGIAHDTVATLARFDALQCKGAADARAASRSLRAQREAAPAADAHALAAGLTVLRDADLRSDVTRLACASTWLFGDGDALVPAAAAAQLRMLLPTARVVTCRAANHLPGLSLAGTAAQATLLHDELLRLLPESA